jgi:RND family efflux transporter MFP subunit
MSTPPDLSALRIDRGTPTPSPGRRAPGLAIALLVAVALAGLGTAWWRLAPRTPLVRVALAEATGGGTASGDGITANGYVVARTKASVSAKILGRLSWIGVTEGSEVKSGAIIARIEDSDYQAALAVARANILQFQAQIAQAKRDLSRSRSLREQNLIADAELENAQTKLDVLTAQLGSARAQAKVAEANLENTLVRAPFSGTVLRKDAELGEIVAPSSAGGGLTRTAIVTMADLRTLEVEVDVNEAYIAQVRGGQEARITLDAYPDTAFSGRVRQVVPTADRQKATVLVKVSILDHDPRILPEMGAKVVFESRGAAAAAAPRRVLVPEGAVVRAGGDAYVWTVDDGRVRHVNVDVGAPRGERLEIRQGLAGGESLVLEPPATLRDGQKVRTAGR